MSGLTGLFKAIPDEGQDNEKLVDLFRNRVELKKEFAVLRDEKYQLQDRLKQSEGSTARVQQKMDHLENLLLDREWVHNVVTFYQLTRLAGHCSERLGRFAEELKQQREQRLQGKVTNAWNAERDERIAMLEANINKQQLQIQSADDQLASDRQRLAEMNSVSKMMNGGKASAEIEQLESRIADERAKEREMMSSLSNVHCLQPPTHEGLDIETKRSINLMILSFAQQLYLHFREDSLGDLAKEASEKSVGAINYGSKTDCDVILALIEKRWDSIDCVSDSAGRMRKRANFIRKEAGYRDDDPVPMPATVATVYDIDDNGVVNRLDVNILGDNYFGIAKVLSR